MTRAPKKSDWLEVRLDHATKQAFMERCRAEGRSASETVRAFIDGQVAAPAKTARAPLRLLAAAAALTLVAAVAAPSLAHTGLADAFARLDADHDGFISRPEFLRGAQVQATVSIGGDRSQAALDARTRYALAGNAFAAMDADHDGRIDFAEFRRASR
jgi:hypothetical protein